LEAGACRSVRELRRALPLGRSDRTGHAEGRSRGEERCGSGDPEVCGVADRNPAHAYTMNHWGWRGNWGNATVKVLPTPGWLIHSTAPWWLSAIHLTMAKPRPNPPSSRERE